LGIDIRTIKDREGSNYPPKVATLDSRKWKYEDRLRLLFAVGFGALLGLTTDYFPGDVRFNVSLSAGLSIVVGLFGSYSLTS